MLAHLLQETEYFYANALVAMELLKIKYFHLFMFVSSSIGHRLRNSLAVDLDFNKKSSPNFERLN